MSNLLEDMEQKNDQGEEEMAKIVSVFTRNEVADWDDEVKAQARFKALSGQRSDWEPMYLFWRDLIIKVCQHLKILILNPDQVKNTWFRRNGLSPLCLDRVLLEMRNAGDLLVPESSYFQPTSRLGLSHVFIKAVSLLGFGSRDDSVVGDCYVVAPLLKEKAEKVVKSLSEKHWTSSCVVTMSSFHRICGGLKEGLAVVNYLSRSGKGSYLVVNHIEGVKICLDPGAIPSTSSIDYNILHLTSTAEKLEQQLDLIDQRYDKIRNLALASLRSGNKRAALKYAKELTLASSSREKCMTLFSRVEEVLRVISDAESSKQVAEAIKIGAQAIKENQISVEELELSLKEISENIDSLKQIDSILESAPGYALEDENLEDEFKNLEMEMRKETEPEHGPSRRVEDDSGSLVATDVLSQALSNLSVKDDTSMNSEIEHSQKLGLKKTLSRDGNLEAA